jgi:biotin-(acetyl-CoA carboxylase) ligase
LIKWPNDVLIQGGKLAGILVEARWSDVQLTNLVLGVGINIATGSTSAIVEGSEYHYPATSLAAHLSHPVDRLQVLHDCLAELIYWRSRIYTDELLQAWESNLAFRGEWVNILHNKKTSPKTIAPLMESETNFQEVVQIIRLASDGALIIRTHSGELMTIYDGEIRQKPDIIKGSG